MLTTLQARAIIRKHDPNAGRWYNPIWTNKLKDPTLRTVKCYDAGNTAKMIKELKRQGGAKNVRITPPAGDWPRGHGGIVVTCRFE